MTTGIVWHELYMWHDTGTYAGIMRADPAAYVQPSEHNEHPETKRRIKNLLDASGYSSHLEWIVPRPASAEEIAAIHPASYVEHLKQVSVEGGELSLATPMGVGSFEIAQLSAGGCIALLEALLAGKVDNGYALVRPPGHHALADAALGFCFFANGALTAKAAQSKGLEKVAIVDWDVHHGNGPEAIFYEDPSVLTISLHQDNCFPPDSGAAGRRGAAAGEGFNINVPLPPGSGRGAYLYAFEQVVLPALDSFTPDLILVASGFDSMGQDPLGRNMLYADVYGALTKMLMAAADRHCAGRLMMTHEGGYNPHSVPFAALKVLETLTGIASKVEDPFGEFIAAMGGQDLQPHQRQLIDEIAARL